MKTFKFIALSTAAALFAAALPASADPGKSKGKGVGNGQGQTMAAERADQSRRAYTRLGDYERGILRDYYASDCPPGLAKKNNGCLPPGIAKKRYQVGRPLGPDIYVREAPYDLVRRLPYLDDGYGYRIVDGDLAVVDLATRVVLDAIGLY